MRRILVLFLLALATTFAFADGCLFRRGVEAKPAIPYQRAVVSHRDGVETLIVESVLNAPEGDYGWVVPVPSKPTSVSAASSGALECFERNVRLGGTMDVPEPLLQGALLGVSLLFSMLVFRKAQIKLKARDSLAIALFGAFLASLFTLILWPVYAGGTSNLVGGMTPWTRIGSYDVAVVPPDTPALTSWLEGNGFKIDPPARRAIEQYVKEGWSFLAAKIHQDSDRVLASPHPLKVVFDTAEPVYPMRLTGTMQRPVQLDLFAIGDKQASARGFQAVACRQVTKGKYPSPEPSAEVTPDWSPVAHPDVISALWEDAWITRLRATMLPSQQAEDVHFSWVAPSVFSVSLYSHKAATKTALMWALVAMTIACWFGGYYCANKEIARVDAWKRIGMIVCVVGLVVGGGKYLSLPRGDLVDFHRNKEAGRFDRLLTLSGATESPAEAVAELKQMSKDQESPVGSPDTCSVEDTADGWRVKVYDKRGREYTSLLKRQPQTKSSKQSKPKE